MWALQLCTEYFQKQQKGRDVQKHLREQSVHKTIDEQYGHEFWL